MKLSTILSVGAVTFAVAVALDAGAAYSMKTASNDWGRANQGAQVADVVWLRSGGDVQVADFSWGRSTGGPELADFEWGRNTGGA